MSRKKENSENWNNNLVSPFYGSLLQNDREHIYKYNTTLQWFEAVRTIIQSSIVQLRYPMSPVKPSRFWHIVFPTTTNGN